MGEQIPSNQIEPFPKKRLLLIALVQGLSLYWLQQAHKHHFWPDTQPEMALVLLSLALAVPTLFLLSLTQTNTRRIIIGGGGFAVVLALASGYFATQLEPRNIIPEDSLLFIYYITFTLMLFKATMYIQVWASGAAFTYRDLFQYSWRNSLLMAVNVLFVLIFAGILLLWAQLFDVVGISFFKDLFGEEWFLFPTLSLAYGLAFCIFRDLVHILDTVARVLQALCQFLLPLLVAIALMFLLTLPFVGLDALWDTGKGTALVLWLLALVLFFVNAVYQDEQRNTPYWQPLHRFIYIGVVVLPCYSLIAAYGLYLRVDQYGLSVERCWAMVVTLIMALFAFGYAGAIIRLRDNWVSSFRVINISMGLVFLTLMVLVNSPLLDFRKLSLSSQISRLEAGEITLEKMDLRYIAQHLGRPGYLYLEELKTGSSKKLEKRIASLYYFRGLNQQKTRAEVKDNFTVVPAVLKVPPELEQKIFKKAKNYRYGGEILLFQVDLNDDGLLDWIQISEMAQGDWSTIELWYFEDEQWQRQYMNSAQGRFQMLRERVIAGDIQTLSEKWNKLKIGDAELRVSD